MGFSRIRANDRSQLQELADALVSAKKIVMITGAGISTSCGIPDFRSPEGLYSLIKTAHGDASNIGTKGKDLFDSNLWRDAASTQTFYKFIASLRQKIANDVSRTSTTHKLIAKLKDQRKLVRCYTQNIDGLETREGLSMELQQGKGNAQRFGRKAMGESQSLATSSKGGIHHAGCEVVPLHGDMKELRCTVCLSNTSWTSERHESMLRGQAPPCPDCEEKDMIRTAMGRRGLKVGALRPDIVLYGENHPNMDSIAKITESDLRVKPDVLLVMGTSLKVHGLKTLVREFAKAVHDKKGGKVIFINLTEPAESMWKDVFDCWVEMDCDGWVSDMRRRRKELWMTQGQLETKITKFAASKDAGTKGKAGAPDQENIEPFASVSGAEATKLPTPKVVINRGLKRSASRLDLPVPNTPKRRKPLAQLATPPSSGRHHRTMPVSREEKHAFFDRLERLVTPEKISTPRTPMASLQKASMLTPESTPSSRRQDLRIKAVSLRGNVALPAATNPTSNTPKRIRQTRFAIYEEGTTPSTSIDQLVVPDSEGEEGGIAQKAFMSSQNKEIWQDVEEDTIELIPSPLTTGGLGRRRPAEVRKVERLGGKRNRSADRATLI